MLGNFKEDSLSIDVESQQLNSDLALPTKTSQREVYGWICPKCGAVMSPYQEFCIKCNGIFDLTYIANTSTTGNKYIVPPSSECSTNADGKLLLWNENK